MSLYMNPSSLEKALAGKKPEEAEKARKLLRKWQDSKDPREKQEAAVALKKLFFGVV
jgi:hypothetical protein